MSSEPIKTRQVDCGCGKHGKYTGIAETFIIMGTKREYMPYCPQCKIEDEVEWQKHLSLIKKNQEEKEKQEYLKKLQSMNIGKLFYESTFDNFDAYNDELREHLETCRKFTENPDGKLIMLGEHGNGKTHLAISILKTLGGVIYTALEIAINLRSSFNNGERSEAEIFDELCTANLLVIDEVEKIKESEWKNYWMSHVVGKRYNNMLPTIFISNCHVQNDCTVPDPPCPKCLEFHLENDVLSRIIEDGIIMKFNSADYREKKRESRNNDKV